MATRFHRLLKGTDTKPGFLCRIGLPEAEERLLRFARDAIRKELTEAFRRVGSEAPLHKAFLVEAAYRSDAFLNQLKPAPKFRGQGSHAYHTLNDPVPEYTPPQQVDLDDGVFLPTSFVAGERPAIAARAYFKVVEDALEPLCKKEGWTLCRGAKAKSSCVRILVNSKIHIDLPLYALPDEDYEKAEALAKAMNRGTLAEDAIVLGDAEYLSIPEDHIMLALRDGTWRRSDPRKLGDWFQAAVARHNPHLRHVCRYLKAWRDFQWADPEDGISSITLMATAVRVMDENRTRLDSSREDDALLCVAESLPELLRQRVKNPVVDGEHLDDSWSPETRAGFVVRAETLRAALASAMNATQADAVIAQLQGCFGERVPNDPDLIEVLPSQEAAILSQPRRFTPAPVVGRSVSG